LLDEGGEPQMRLINGEPVQADEGTPILPDGLWKKYQDGALESCRMGGVYVVERQSAAGTDGESGTTAVFAPLNVSSGSLVGVIQVEEEGSDERLSPDLLGPLDILAVQTAYIVENARLLARASQSAETLEEQVE